MRNAMLALGTLPLFVLAAFAHGGGSFRGPNGVVPPGSGHWKRGIPCACALPDCAKCGANMLRPEQLARCEIETEELERWDDVARCRVVVTIRAKEEPGRVDAWVPVPAGTPCAAVGASMGIGGQVLSAWLKPAQDARRVYLWERRRYVIDPLLVDARREGILDVRVFPVSAAEDTMVVLEVYRLAAPRSDVPVRLYRTGDRVLAVRPGGRFDGRSLVFLEAADARARFPGRPVVDAPFVHAMESAVTGGGAAAACADTSLAAVADGATPPPFVGEDQWVEGDPPPPPPPPDDQATAKAAATSAPATTPGSRARA